MSGNYSAGQFDHAFKPIKLLNYQLSTNPWPGKYAICSPLKFCSTCYNSNDCGHLFPWIPRNAFSSAWGDYANGIWEQTVPCHCIRMLRHPEKYVVPPRPIFINKPTEKTVRKVRNPSCPDVAMEGYPEPCVLGLQTMMTGDSKTVQNRIRKQRRAQKMSMMKGRGRNSKAQPSPEVLTFRFTMSSSCGDGAKPTRAKKMKSKKCKE